VDPAYQSFAEHVVNRATIEVVQLRQKNIELPRNQPAKTSRNREADKGNLLPSIFLKLLARILLSIALSDDCGKSVFFSLASAVLEGNTAMERGLCNYLISHIKRQVGSAGGMNMP
jgi:hypothetical protein